MKKIVILAISVLGLNASAATTAVQQATTTDSRFELVWADEFNKSGAPDPKKWDYEEGFVRNREQQYYTRNKRKNARVEQGYLVIEGHKEKVKNKRYKKGSKNWQEEAEYAEYTSAALVTLGKFSQKYGRFEFRAKLPKGKGVWPAIWMMGDDIRTVGYPKCGEIDVMEFIGDKEPKNTYSTLHFPPLTNATKFKSSAGGKTQSETLSTEFHIYALEWFPDHIDFFLDTQKFHSVKFSDIGGGEPFHKPFYILINLALGAQWPGPIDPNALPQQFLIDYVRVYKLKEDAKK